MKIWNRLTDFNKYVMAACLCVAMMSGWRVVFADGYLTPSSVQSVNGCTAICNFPVNIGPKTIAALPACDNSTTLYGSVAYVTDLGGGANNVKCVNGFWQHFTLGTPQTNSNTTTSTVSWTPLTNAPIQQLTGTISLANTVTMQIQTTNLYPGYEGCVIAPPSILGVLNLTVAGTGINIGLLGSAHSCFVWNGTALVQVS